MVLFLFLPIRRKQIQTTYLISVKKLNFFVPTLTLIPIISLINDFFLYQKKNTITQIIEALFNFSHSKVQLPKIKPTIIFQMMHYQCQEEEDDDACYRNVVENNRLWLTGHQIKIIHFFFGFMILKGC